MSVAGICSGNVVVQPREPFLLTARETFPRALAVAEVFGDGITRLSGEPCRSRPVRAGDRREQPDRRPCESGAPAHPRAVGCAESAPTFSHHLREGAGARRPVGRFHPCDSPGHWLPADPVRTDAVARAFGSPMSLIGSSMLAKDAQEASRWRNERSSRWDVVGVEDQRAADDRGAWARARRALVGCGRVQSKCGCRFNRVTVRRTQWCRDHREARHAWAAENGVGYVRY